MCVPLSLILLQWFLDLRELFSFVHLASCRCSVGNAGNLAFEDAAFTRLKSRPFVFDPKLPDSEREFAKSRRFIKYMPYGIGAEKQLSALKRAAPAGQIWRYYTLAQVMSKLNHSHVDVVKVRQAGVHHEKDSKFALYHGTRPLQYGCCLNAWRLVDWTLYPSTYIFQQVDYCSSLRA